jgi:hypothetical protein
MKESNNPFLFKYKTWKTLSKPPYKAGLKLVVVALDIILESSERALIEDYKLLCLCYATLNYYHLKHLNLLML